MKKLLVMSYNVDIGGIEKSLVTLLKQLNSIYDITLVLESRSGLFLSEIPSNVKVIEYSLSNKSLLIRKFVNRIKYIYYYLLFKNKFDFVICYAPYISRFAKLTTKISDKNLLYIHSDYTKIYDEVDFRKFFDDKNIYMFSNIAFVSIDAYDNFNKIYKLNNKSHVINNLVDDNSIIEMANNEVVNFIDPYFIWVGRMEEDAKKLTRLLIAIKTLKNLDYSFKLYVIGDGLDFKLYNDYVVNNNLSDYVIFTGKLYNPYPYFLNAKAFILSSDYEGYPVVYLESLLLNCPIITTIKISDENIELNNSNSIIVEKTSDSIVSAMRDVLDNKITFNIEFDVNKFNALNLNKLIEVIGGIDE